MNTLYVGGIPEEVKAQLNELARAAQSMTCCVCGAPADFQVSHWANALRLDEPECWTVCVRHERSHAWRDGSYHVQPLYQRIAWRAP